MSTERGQGYAIAALQDFLTHFFEQVGGQMMIDDVALTNGPGQALLRKFGFEQDAQYPDACRLVLSREQFNRRPTIAERIG